ncbi:MAG TPA: hypothetical protein VJB12_03900 [Candidatus Nanoarchaeia archaeon]|nr:hypothetical protein [Candidatus Nanoarchaeia archaeon]
MKALVFDSGPLISLTLNNLLGILKPLKQRFKGEFYITQAVYDEVVGHPLQTRRFKFEAFQVLKLIREGTLKIYESATLKQKTLEIIGTANSIYFIHGQPLRVFHYAEMSVMAACVEVEAQAAIVDEQMTRIVLENPSRVLDLLKKRMHAIPSVNTSSLFALQNKMGGVKVLRSTEIAAIAFELGILSDYLTQSPDVKQPRAELLDAILWGLKINGCAISQKEIRQIVKIETK